MVRQIGRASANAPDAVVNALPSPLHAAGTARQTYLHADRGNPPLALAARRKEGFPHLR